MKTKFLEFLIKKEKPEPKKELKLEKKKEETLKNK